jgi:hypothetical protein
MEKTAQKNDLILFNDVKPIEFERVLSLYGMKKQDYCNLRSKSKSWWHNFFIRKKQLNYLDIKVFTDEVGLETYNQLLARVREQVDKTGHSEE